MKKIQLTLLEEDHEYIEFLSDYLRSSEWRNRVELNVFTNERVFQEYLMQEPVIQLVLLSENANKEWKIDRLKSDSSLMLIVLNDTQHQQNEGSVFKFQPADRLMSKIITTYAEVSETSLSSGNVKTKLLSFYSAMGGVGKTSLAVNLSRQLALVGENVFYLNLELMNSTSLFFNSPEDQHTSQLFYYAKAKPELLPVKLEELVKRDPYNQVDYFDLAVNAEEMKDFTAENLRTVIQALAGSGTYDYILVDLDSSMEERVREALMLSDLILWVLSNDVRSFHKTSHLLEFSERLFGKDSNLKEKIFFILNGYMGSVPSSFERFDVPVHVQLPAMKEWEQMESGRALTTTTIFPDHVLKLIMQEDLKDGVPLG
ncbi:AAA family ATPase [Thalassobacillus hwangdonensis]|uniref:AAA family ATPase n=1 Tax=Thalassobacillus hwangdonensis TaxID=546108 RepID=A0ABW3KVW3_9BACI